MENNLYNALRNKILGAMIIVPAIPFVLVVLIGYQFFRSSLHWETISKVARIVEDHDQMIESFLLERKSDLQFVVDSYGFPDLTDKTLLTDVLGDLQKKSAAFTDIGVFNEEGVHLAYVGPFELEGKVYLDAEWFRETLLRGYYVSDVYLGYRNIPHFVMAVVSENNGQKWILRATMDSSLFSRVVEKIRIGRTGEAYIVNTRGQYQTERRSGGELMEKADDPGLPPPGRKGVSTFVAEDETGETYLYAASWLEGKDWLVVARQEKSEAFSRLSMLTLIVILVAILGGLFIVFIAFNVTSRIIARIKEVDLEKKELGRQLVVAGRLAEIGEMSAGFAHEINNPLQIIKSEMTLVETILDDQGPGSAIDTADMDEIKDSFQQIKYQVDRCGDITKALLKFARKRESQAGKVDLHTFLPQTIHLIENKANVEGIEIVREIPEQMPPAYADPAGLEQVLVNLLNNAIYAVVNKPGGTGGCIRVTAGQNGEDKVAITVADNGGGISAEDIEKIFVPFFSTKPVGQGTGLGLPICFGIITEMGGKIDVSSEPGVGATFTIFLKQA